MAIKTKSNFEDTAPQTIKARLWSVEASLIVYHLVGRGAYPYDCQHAKQYPDAYIYENDRGGWVGSYQLELRDDGTYLIRSVK